MLAGADEKRPDGSPAFFLAPRQELDAGENRHTYRETCAAAIELRLDDAPGVVPIGKTCQ